MTPSGSTGDPRLGSGELLATTPPSSSAARCRCGWPCSGSPAPAGPGTPVNER
ncbi:hypothetical protein HBB16_19015 [Pseudonocardia sp. MCCB 268]|nr:hypothetical protein [Pseudonocardia cytotoxica]